MNVTAHAIAAVLGVKLVAEATAAAPSAIGSVPDNPNLDAALAAVAMPGPGQDTRAATRAIIDKLKAAT